MIAMPVTTLSLSSVSMSEAGFKYMVSQFYKMHQRSLQTNREFEEQLNLDVSKNMLSDDSIKSFAELITKFEGFRSVNLMSIRPRMNKKDTGYLDLAKALRENKSIVELDLRDNEIIESSTSKILEALEYNFVISDVKIDIKSKYMPANFSSYALQSMYEFTLSVEDINLGALPTTNETDR